jgi:hypothetical protein
MNHAFESHTLKRGLASFTFTTSKDSPNLVWIVYLDSYEHAPQSAPLDLGPSQALTSTMPRIIIFEKGERCSYCIKTARRVWECLVSIGYRRVPIVTSTFPSNDLFRTLT